MNINVAGVLKEYGAEIPINGAVEQKEAEFMGERFVFITPLTVEGRITNRGAQLKLEAKAEGRAIVHCARCGVEMTTPIAFTINEALRQNNGESPEDEDIICFEGTDVVLDDIVLNALFMNAPTKYLCQEDCKGLCPHCGKNLNEGACECADNTEIDPRWTSLAQIMKNMPEDSSSGADEFQ